MDLPGSWTWFVPLVAVLLGRWLMLFGTRLVALVYRPAPVGAGRATDVSVVVLAGEGTATLRRGVESWLAAGARQVIVLVGADDVAAQRIIERYPVHVLRRRPSDRASLRAGWQVATGECVAFTRADAVWTRETARQAAAPFADTGVGGVSVRENTVGGGVLARLADMEMDLRGLDGAPAASVRGAVTGWGATAVLRRRALEEVADDFMAGRDGGRQADVDALAGLVLDAGHGLVFQRTARTWRPAPTRAEWLTARLAADRAGWRRLAALGRARTWRRPGVALGLLAWAVAAPAALVVPVYVVAALALGRPDLALLIVAVAVFTRLVLLLPHLRRRPTSFPVALLSPLAAFAAGLVRLAALVPVRHPDAAGGAPDPVTIDPVTIDPALRLRPIRPRPEPDAAPAPAAPALAVPRPAAAPVKQIILEQTTIEQPTAAVAPDREPSPSGRPT